MPSASHSSSHHPNPTAAATRRATLKVGLLTVGGFVLLVLVLFWLRGRGLAGEKTFSVNFTDVDGLRVGAPVQVMGIRVGFVDDVVPVADAGRYFVKVQFSINADESTIPRGSQISIQQSGLIGEKFVEITPPALNDVVVSVPVTASQPVPELKPMFPVQFQFEDGLKVVGQVEKVEALEPLPEVLNTKASSPGPSSSGNTALKNLLTGRSKTISAEASTPQLIRKHYRLAFRITEPGAILPDSPTYSLLLSTSSSGNNSVLKIGNYLGPIPRLKSQKTDLFTVINPLRFKDFLVVQMESAQALKTTNDKINQLLSEDTMDSLNRTLKNTEEVSAQAVGVLKATDQLFNTMSGDLNRLVVSGELLATNVNKVSQNVNDIIGDPKVKSDLASTVASVQKSTQQLSQILQDPALKETLLLSRDTTKNAAELTQQLKQTLQDKDLQNRLDTSLTLLNTSLDRMSNVLGNVEQLTSGDEDQSIKGIIQDTRQTAENLRRFSEKINGRFSLIKMIF